MAYQAISNIPTQYSTGSNVLAAGYYLKFYEAGTTTPLNMATDAAGGTLLDKCKISTKGYPLSNPADNNSVFIPHMNADYKVALYLNDADADADTTGNADWVQDNIPGGISTPFVYLNLTSLKNDASIGSSDIGQVYDVAGIGQVKLVAGATSINYITTVNGQQLEPLTPNAVLFGAAVNDLATDSLDAFERCAAQYGDGGYWYTTNGQYHLSDALEFQHDDQRIGLEGVIFDNTVVAGRPGISYIGEVLIDGQLNPVALPMIGALDVYGQRATRAVKVINLDGVAYVTGGTYRAQVADMTALSITAEDCGAVAYQSHGLGAMMCYSRVPVPSTLGLITNGGSGYNDGRWMVTADTLTGTGTDAILCIDVVGGVVTKCLPVFGGAGYATNDTVGFTIGNARKRDQSVMTTGSGFVYTAGDVTDSSTWFNSNSKTSMRAHLGWYDGIATSGKINYNKYEAIYMEAIWTRDRTPFRGTNFLSNTFEICNILINVGVGETTLAATKLIDFSGTSDGNTFSGGRTGNPYSSSTEPLIDLVNLGSNYLLGGGVDWFSGPANSRGKLDEGTFTPTFAFSTMGDAVITYNTQIGFYWKYGKIVQFKVFLDFDTNAYTTAAGACHIDIADLMTKMSILPTSALSFWDMPISHCENVQLEAGAQHLYGRMQNNTSKVLLYQSISAAASNTIGNGEIDASTSGYKIGVSGWFESKPN